MNFDVKRLTVGPFQENTWYVIQNESRNGILIDPGDEPEKIVQLIAETETTPIAIYNTHAHLDHIGAVKHLQDRYNLPFYLNEADEFLIEQYPQHAAMFGVPMNGIPRVTHYVNDEMDSNSILSIGNFKIQVVPTPGHTPGGVSYLIEDELFVGDTLFDGSIGRTDLPGGNYNTLMESIVQRLMSLDSDILVHCGHGPDTTIGKERQANPFIQEWLQAHQSTN